jgi:hypothetical protein
MMKRRIALFLGVLFVLVRLPAGPFTEIVKKYGISININTEAADFFPESWLQDPENATAERMDPDELARMPRILARALSKYPVSVIQYNIQAINLAGWITIYETDFGATSSSDIVYLTSTGVLDGYTDEVIEEGFHHEFAHILKRNYDFPASAWDACNPPDFSYYDSGVKAIQNGFDSQEGDTELFEEGFLTEYSLAEQDEDFSTFSEWIFTYQLEFKPLIEEYPKLKKKFEVWLRFMKSVSRSFTEEMVLGRR